MGRVQQSGLAEAAITTRAQSNTLQNKLLWVFPILLVTWVHYPVLAAGFYADDYLNFYDLIHNGPLEFIVRIHGGHSLVVRNSLFYLFYQLFGLEPSPYLVFTLAIHLTNVVLLQRMLRHFAASPMQAAFFATLWGVSPVAFGVIGWYSAACHAMMTTLVLWVLGDVARAAHQQAVIPWTTAIRWCLLLLAGASTFGGGIVVALLSPLVVFLLLPPGTSRKRATIALGLLSAAMPLLYLLHQYAMGVVAHVPSDRVISGFSLATALDRSFDILRTLIDFLSYGLASLLLGPWIATTEAGIVVGGPFAGHSAHWVITTSNVLFVVFCVVLVVFVWKRPKQRLKPVAAIVLLCGATYGSIVLARLFLYQSHPAFALQPRYHYLGPVLLVTLVSILASWITATTTMSARSRAVAVATFMIVWTVLSGRSAHELSEVLYARSGDEFAQSAAFLHKEIHKTPPGSPVFIDNRQYFTRPFFASFWKNYPARFPGLAASFVMLYPEDVVDGRRVYFVEQDSTRLQAMRQRDGSRLSGLILSPEEARLLR
jgi:hypothetical protein